MTILKIEVVKDQNSATISYDIYIGEHDTFWHTTLSTFCDTILTFKST